MASMANESAVAAQAMAALNAESAANAVRLAAHDQIPLDPTPADEVAALRSRIAALETERDNLRLCVGELLEARERPVKVWLDKEWRRLAYGQPAIAEPKPALPARALGPQHQTVGNGGRLTGLWR